MDVSPLCSDRFRRLMNHQHPLDKGFKLGQLKLARGVAQGFVGARVGFKEEAIDAGGHRCAGEGF